MAHHNTVFAQLLKFLPRHEFEAEARRHQHGQGLRVMSRWAQFAALGLAQLTGRQSLRDIVSNLAAQGRKLYHLGVGTVSRSSLARVNTEQPYTLYEALFERLLGRCREHAPRHGFRFKNKLYAVDASTIDLCLAVFPWATFRRTKAAIKLHVGLDEAGHLPSFVSVTEGKTADVTVVRTWIFPAGSVVVADRAYMDFKWFHQLQAQGVTFVTRLKRGVRYRVTDTHGVRRGTGVISDETIELTSARGRKAYAAPLRRVVYKDPVTKNRYVFVTNNTTWVAKTIADIYKSALLKRVWVGAAPISGSTRGAGGAGGLGIERSWCSPDPAADGRTSGGSGRSGVAPGRPACQRATRVLRCAAALRVTHRPSRRSDSSYGPCGPAWTGASRPSTTTRPARRPAVGDRRRLIGPTATPGPGAGPGTPVGRGAGAACVVSFCRSGCKRRGFLVS